MQPNDPTRHAIIGWLTEKGHSPKAIERIIKRLDQHDSQAVYRALFEDDKTSEIDVHAIIEEVEGEFVAAAREEISSHLAERGRSPREVEQILKRLEQHDVQVVRQVLAEAATDSSLLDVLEEVRGDSLLARFVSRCGDAARAHDCLKTVEELCESFGSFEAIHKAVDGLETQPGES
jgi:predicted Zn-ribbon and HTH transcriptional regulator